MFNLIKKQDDDNYSFINEVYLYVKDPNETKYQVLVNKRENADINHCNYSEALTEYSDKMDYTYRSIEEYDPNKKLKLLIKFDDMNAGILNNKIN